VGRNLFIIRGLSGSGKTTLANVLANYPRQYDYSADGVFEHPVLSADDYFLDKEGKYNWVGTLLPEAHAWCLNSTEHWM